jgi:hypothetical protein
MILAINLYVWIRMAKEGRKGQERHLRDLGEEKRSEEKRE